MAEKFSVDSTDLLPNIRGSRDMGDPGWTDEGWKKNINGEHTTDAERTPRTISFIYVIQALTVDLMHDELDTLKALLNRANYVLTANDGGAVETDRYYDCLGLRSLIIKLSDEMPTEDWLEWEVAVEIEARPFARKAALELPRNWVKNPGMNEDFSGDGIPEGFVTDDSGIPATGTVSVISPADDPDGYGFTRIAVTAGAAGRYKGIKQTLAVANNVETEEHIWYRVTGVANSGSARVYVENGGVGNLVDTAIDVGDWTIASLTQTGNGSGRVLHIQALTGAAGSTVILDVMMPHVSETADGTVPTGKDGTNVISYGSSVTTSPASLPMRNIPGGVDAQVFMQVIAGESSAASGTEDQLVVGGGLSGAHIISFGGEVDANALGGMCSVAETTAGEHIVALDPALRGRFLVAGRLKVLTSGTPASNTFRLNVYPNASSKGTPYSTTTISPCAVLGKWQGAFFFGTIELPMGGRPEWDWTTAEPQNSLGLECVNLASASWKRDFLALIPLRQGHGRIAGEIVASSATKAALFDTIGDPPGAYFEYELDSSTVIAVTASGGTHNWYWGSSADYLAQIRSVYMPECDDYTTVTPSCGGCTFVSYDSTSKVARFATGATTTWNVTIVRPAADWWNYASLNTVSNPTEPPDFDPIFIPAGDSVLIPMVAEYVNDANQNFKNVGAKVTLRIVPRYL